MQIEEIALADLKPYENNPRDNSGAVDALANSLAKFGWQQPIVIDKDNVIVCGHTRYLAAQKIGMKKAPCKRAEDLSEEQIAAYRLADNKIAELSAWDFAKLDEELEKLEFGECDMRDFGFINATSINDDLLNDYFDDVETDEANGTRKKLIKCPYCGKEFER